MRVLKKLLLLFLILSLIDNGGFLQHLEAAPNPVKTSGNTETFDPNTLSSDELQQYVHIGKIFPGNERNNLTFIHVRDLHCNYEAQMNIAKALEKVEKDLKKAGYLENQPLLVLTEGADGAVDTSLVSSLPDKEIRKLSGREFVKSGKMTGPEYVSMARAEEKPVQIEGVEDADLYVRDLMAFRNVIGEKPRTIEFTREVEEWLVMLKEKVFSPDLLEADEKEGSFHDGALAFDEYVKFLSNKASENKLLPTGDFPNFILMMDLVEKQKDVELEKVESERNDVMRQLSEKIPKDELAALIKGSLEFRLGKKSAKDYFDGLQAMIEKHLKTEDYPNLFKYIALVKLQSEINHAVLMDEVDILSRKLQEYLVKTAEEKEILEFSRVIQILSRMTRLEMTREDLAYYQTHKDKCQIPWIMERMDQLTLKHSLKLSMNLKDEKKTMYVAKAVKGGEQFYDYALKRDQMMVAKAMQAVEEDHVQVAVLITGGFHSDGVTKILEDKEISYVVATPRVTGEPDMKKYYELMMDQRISVTTISMFSFFNEKLASRFGQMQVKELQGFVNTMLQLMNSRRVDKSVAQAWVAALEAKGGKEGLSEADQAVLKEIQTRIGAEEAPQELPALGEGEIKELITNKNYNILTAELTLQVLEEMNHPALSKAKEWYTQRILGLEKLRERPKLVNDIADAKSQLTSLLAQGGVTDLSYIQEAFDLLVKASETVLTTGEQGRYHELFHSFEVTMDSLSNALKGGIKGDMLEALAFAALFHDLAVLEKGSSVYAVHEELSAKRFFDILSGMIERAPPEAAKKLQNIQDWGARFILMTQFTGAFFVPANLYNLMNNDIVETEGGTGLQFRSDKTADAFKYPSVVSKVSLESEMLNSLRKVGAAIGIADLKSALSSERYLFMLEGLFDEYVISDQRRAGSTFLANLGWVSAYDAFKGTWGFIQFGLLLPGVGRLANFNAVLGTEAGVLAEDNLQNLSVNRAIFQKLQGLIETVRKGQPLSGDQLTLLKAFRELIQDNEQLLSPESSEVLKNLLALLEADHAQLSGHALSESHIQNLRNIRDRPFFAHEAHKILVKNADPADIEAARAFYQADKKNEETYRKALAEAEAFLRQRTPVDEALQKAQADLKTAPAEKQGELNAEINRLKGEGTKYPPAMMLSNRIHFYKSRLETLKLLEPVEETKPAGTSAFEVDYTKIENDVQRSILEGVLKDSGFARASLQNTYPEMAEQNIVKMTPKLLTTAKGEHFLFEVAIEFANGQKRSLLVFAIGPVSRNKDLADKYKSISGKTETAHRFGTETSTTVNIDGAVQNYQVFSTNFHEGVPFNDVVTALEEFGRPGKSASQFLLRADEKDVLKVLNRLEKWGLLQYAGIDKQAFLNARSEKNVEELKRAQTTLQKLLLELEGGAVAAHFELYKKTGYAQSDPRRNNVIFAIENGQPVFKLIDYEGMREVNYSKAQALNDFYAIFDSDTASVRSWAWTYMQDKSGFFDAVLKGMGETDGIQYLMQAYKELALKGDRTSWEEKIIGSLFDFFKQRGLSDQLGQFLRGGAGSAAEESGIIELAKVPGGASKIDQALLPLARTSVIPVSVQAFVAGKLDEVAAEGEAKGSPYNLVITGKDLAGNSFEHPALTSQVLQTLFEIAKEHHKDQTRKDGPKTNYLAHVLGVVSILVHELGVHQLDEKDQAAVVAAAFLHDVFEDSIYYFKDGRRSDENELDAAEKERIRTEITARIGGQLREAGLPADITDRALELAGAMTKREGLALDEYYENLKKTGMAAVALKVADRMYNIRDFKYSTEEGFAAGYFFGRPEKNDRGTIEEFLPFISSLPAQMQNAFRKSLLEQLFANARNGGLNQVSRDRMEDAIKKIVPGIQLSGGTVEQILQQALAQLSADMNLTAGSSADAVLAAQSASPGVSEEYVRGFIRDYAASRLGMDRVRLIAGLAEALAEMNISGTLLDAALGWAENELRDRALKTPENGIDTGIEAIKSDAAKAGNVLLKQNVSKARWDRIINKVQLLITGKFNVNQNGKMLDSVLAGFIDMLKRIILRQEKKDQLRIERLDAEQEKSADQKARSEAQEHMRQMAYINYAQNILNERFVGDELNRLVGALELGAADAETEIRAKKVLLGYLLGQFTGNEESAKNYLDKKDYALLDEQGLNLEQAYEGSPLFEGLIPESGSLRDREKLLGGMAEKAGRGNEEVFKNEDEALKRLFVDEASPLMKRMENLIDLGVVKSVEKGTDQSVVVLDIQSLVKFSEEKDGRMKFEGRGVGLSEAVAKLFEVRPGTRVKLMSPYGEGKTADILKSLGIGGEMLGSAKGQIQIVEDWSEKGFEEILRGAMGASYTRDRAQQDVVVILSEETKNELQKKDMGQFVKEMKIVVGKLGSEAGGQTINDVLGMALILASVDKAFEKGHVTQAVANALNQLIAEMLKEILSKEDISPESDEFKAIQAKMLKQISTEGFFRVPPVTDNLNDMMRQIAIEHTYIDVAA